MHKSRGRDLTPEAVNGWLVRRFPLLRDHRLLAETTPVDDALPEDPWLHLDEFRAASEQFP